MILVLLPVSFATSRHCIAAPVVLTQLDEFEKYAAMTAADSRAGGPDEETPPADLPRPPLQQLVGLVGLGSQSTSDAPVNTRLPRGTSSVGMTAALPTLAQPLARRTPPSEESLFIPPRFLDGVFRPPEARVSL